MTIHDFDIWVQSIMDFSIKDASLNGLQVGLSNKPLKRIAFALDACAQSFTLAKDADLLFVHHGLFWGSAKPVNEELHMYQRVRQLIQYDLALYAVHLPLDAATDCGNNASLAQIAQLTDIEPFASIGLIGNVPVPIYTNDLASKIFDPYPHQTWNHHNKPLKRIAILSGGGAKDFLVQEAVRLNADGYITGEINHQIYHYTSELQLNVIAGGHYWSEYIGLINFAEKVRSTFPTLEIEIYDIPTGC